MLFHSQNKLLKTDLILAGKHRAQEIKCLKKNNHATHPLQLCEEKSLEQRVKGKENHANTEKERIKGPRKVMLWWSKHQHQRLILGSIWAYMKGS